MGLELIDQSKTINDLQQEKKDLLTQQAFDQQMCENQEQEIGKLREERKRLKE